MEVKEISPRRYKPYTDTQKTEAKEKMKKLQKEGEKTVKGMFEFLDAQGGWLDFDYRFYPGEPIRKIRIIHGEIIELTMDLVKHLNNIWKKVRVPSSELNEHGKPLKMGSVQKMSRTRFTPMDVM